MHIAEYGNWPSAGTCNPADATVVDVLTEFGGQACQASRWAKDFQLISGSLVGRPPSTSMCLIGTR